MSYKQLDGEDNLTHRGTNNPPYTWIFVSIGTFWRVGKNCRYSHDTVSLQGGAVDDDAEWERFQKGLTKREKALEGKSKMSHTVHCPYYPEDKQEYWWTYVCDRKKHMLITAPYQVCNYCTTPVI